MNVTLFALELFFLVFSWAFFGLRLWARRLRRQSFELNDYLLLGALIFEVGQTTNFLMITEATDNGTSSSHSPGGSSSAASAGSGLHALPSSLLWGVPLWLVKMSILDFYTRIFRVKKNFCFACYVMMVVVSLWFVVYTTVCFFTCIPMSKIWDKDVPGACIDVHARIIWPIITNFITDVVLVILPLPVIWTLRMSVAKRVQLSLVFGSATGVCVISVLRIIYLTTNDSALATAYTLFTLLEPDLGSVVACLPLMRPILTPISRRFGWIRVNSPEDTTRQTSDRGNLVAGQPMRQTVNNFTASERLQDHLWHIPEMDTGADRTSRGDLESAVSKAGDTVVNNNRL